MKPFDLSFTILASASVGLQECEKHLHELDSKRKTAAEGKCRGYRERSSAFLHFSEINECM